MGQYIFSLSHLAQHVYRFLAVCLSIAIMTIAPFATAQSHISKVSIDNLVGNNSTTLDWKTNEVIIPFDLPETAWVDNVELLVSARPTGQLRQRRNLQLRINGSEPIILKARGQRFDARIRLETKHLRRHGNKLYLSGISTSPSCPGPNSAGWEISQDRTILVFYGRNMTRDLNLRDLDAVWSQNFGAQPLHMGLKVIGEESFRHESLITQGVTLRSGLVPKLNSIKKNNKINIIAGLRTDVLPYINNVKARKGQGAQIILDEQRPPRLILTGDTVEELQASVDAFARHKLPLTRRTITTANEVLLQPFLSSDRAEFDGTHSLSEAGILSSVDTWLTPEQRFSFDTSYAAQRTGQLILRLNGNEKIADDSTLAVTLNGRKLGQTHIDKVRKTVKFDIPEGYIIGANNKIKIQPDLKPSAFIDICSVAQTPPKFSLGLGSKIILKNNVDENINDLSNFAARSGPFAMSKDLVIYGTARSKSEKQATLQLMGRLAQISGRAWTQAQYVDGANALIPPTRNVLIIGPETNAMDRLLANAPKALRLALNGQSVPQIEDEKIASVLKVASLSERQAIALAATSTRYNAQRYASGLIALYDDASNRQTIGVITARSGTSYRKAAVNLLNPSVWNTLTGSVAKWDTETAVMLQTAQPKNSIKGYSLDKLKGIPNFEFDGLARWSQTWMDGLGNIWHAQSGNVKTQSAALWANIHMRWTAIFNASPNTVPSITPNTVLSAAPYIVDNRPVKPKEALRAPLSEVRTSSASTVPYPRIKPALASLNTQKPIGLRGSYDLKTFTNDGLSKVQKTINLSGMKASLSNGIETVKNMSIKSYNDFEAWGERVNHNRTEAGAFPLIPVPMIALLAFMFIGLILMSIATPHQRR